MQPDPKLDAYVDGLIAKIAAAQEPDGYLYTTRTIDPAAPAPLGRARSAGSYERDDSHELYDLGHLFEAAVAHYQATGKRTLLDVAIRSADLLVDTFGPGKQIDLAGPPDHRDGPREAVSRHRRRALPGAREVHARRARARQLRPTKTSTRAGSTTTRRSRR